MSLTSTFLLETCVGYELRTLVSVELQSETSRRNDTYTIIRRQCCREKSIREGGLKNRQQLRYLTESNPSILPPQAAIPSSHFIFPQMPKHQTPKHQTPKHTYPSLPSFSKNTKKGLGLPKIQKPRGLAISPKRLRHVLLRKRLHQSRKPHRPI
ncbi:hypothetical protein EJ08DRAFT_74908 [Tothia fuscella]|uniref:Uncharacterized protein n=1 Tax=Tothia fuscella TaxID=1048955 RepID=A0A9P4NY70_9PEZI|nr:hypothetical protein EJ08DRAFT_74908 [Tothia fuscella]